MNKWYSSNALDLDVVLCSKATIVRNLSDCVYPIKMNKDLQRSVVKKIFACVKNSPLAKDYELILLSEKSKAESLSYVERGVITNDFLNNENASFLLSDSGDTSVMINTDDHISINSFVYGNDLALSYEKANELDSVFIKGLNIAFDKELGFLSSSVSKLGTGLIMSSVLHLPALQERGMVHNLATMLGKLGFSLKETSVNGLSNAFVISNQITLGITEQGIIDNLTAIVKQIVLQERKARELLKASAEFEDKLYRNLGILKLARKLNHDEFAKSISLVRLGIALGFFDYEYNMIDDLALSLNDASLVFSSKSELTQEMCETMRAQIVREKLG